MGQTVLYGVDSKNKIHEIYKENQSMRACFPIWNYLNEKYFPNSLMPLLNNPCWNLEPHEVSEEEYFMLLSSFDGYYFYKENLKEMIKLLEKTHLRENEPVNSSRLDIFREALNHEKYNKFFITATTTADYGEYIDYHYDEELDDYISEPTLNEETVWNIWEEFQEDYGNKK